MGNAVIERFKSWVVVQGMSQGQAAKMCSCSAATLSQVFSGKYAGDTARIIDRMKRVLKRDERKKRAPKRPDIVLTTVCEEVLDALRTAHDEGVMAVVMGPSGVGKTSAVNLYCEAEPETIVVTMRPSGRADRARSTRPILVKIANALGLSLRLEYSNVVWIESVASALKDSGRLIVIDEIDYADETILQVIRNIHDFAQCGMAFIATPAFLARLKRRNSATLSQFLNRLAYCRTVEGLTDEDAEKILESYSLDRTAIAAAREGARGVARRLVYGIIGAQRIARGKPNATDIAKAYSTLMEV